MGGRDWIARVVDLRGDLLTERVVGESVTGRVMLKR